MARKKQTERDRSEFPFAEHLTSAGEPLCGTKKKDPILLDNTADNPPEAICMACRRKLADLAIYDWQEFCQVMVYEDYHPNSPNKKREARFLAKKLAADKEVQK